jgi:hypothetical protein
MIRSGQLRRRSGTRWKFGELPPDLQTLIFEIVDLSGSSALLTRLEAFEFGEWLIPLDAFPFVPLSTDYRAVLYLQRMLNADLPPVILHNRDWIDGRHRIKAWRLQRLFYAKAIDLNELGLPRYEFPLGVLSS